MQLDQQPVAEPSVVVGKAELPAPAAPTVAPTKRAQVKALLEQIIDNRLKPGDAVSSERELVRQLGVSRVTIRQAISDLVDEGLLERVHGKGTYVTGPQVNSRLHLTSFSREMRARGLTPETRVLGASVAAADARVASALGLERGGEVVELRRLRIADGTPMAIEIGHYPCDVFPGLEQKDLSALYDIFATDYGVVTTQGEQSVHAAAADAEQARLLGMPRRAPMLVQERITWSHDRVVETATSWYRGDRYRLHMAVRPSASSPRS